MLSACATSTRHPQDPYENFNRAMFNFNDRLDQAALRPTAEFYQKVTPAPVQAGIGNFFGNIGDVWTGINNLLQGKGKDGLSDMLRVALNTTVGIGGLFDVASSAAKLPKHHEDFGQTLGRWGVTSGPYIVLPVFGPSTFRDTVALSVDLSADPWRYVMPVDVRNSGIALRLIDQRASLLNASDLLEAAALDRYEFVRDSFLQRRESIIYDDGDIPRKKDADAQSNGDEAQDDAKPAGKQ